MRLLYVSVHEPLEYDEITLLQGLGHEVFPLGSYFGEPLSLGRLRPEIDLGPGFPALREAFEATGCRFNVHEPVFGLHLTPEFIDLFDASIVMYLWPAVDRNWEAMSRRTVILRTIGQGLDVFEEAHGRLRGAGAKLVRYAAVEAAQKDYAGSDALIRFGKNPAIFAPWRGDNRHVLTFAASFAQRYPAEFGLWLQSVEGLPWLLGGRGNHPEGGVLGGIGWQEQLDLLRDSRAYFYCSGLALPYTLNFMEAWMAGIPVVVMDPSAVGLGHQYWEIGELITPGVDCLLVHNAAEAQAALRSLLTDDALAARIGAAGRAAAIRHFGWSRIAPEWAAVLGGSDTARQSG